MTRSVEEELIQRYFDAFNRHDLDGVMACFHEHPRFIDMQGVRHEGRAAIQRYYEDILAIAPDGRCTIRSILGQAGIGMVEALFSGTDRRTGRSIRAIGTEVIEFADGKVTGVRDYRRLTDSPDEP